MVIDTLMVFSDKQAAATGTSTNIVDFGQPDPRTGLAGSTDLFIVAIPSEDFAGTIAFTVEHSDNGSSFETLLSIPSTDSFAENHLAIPMPVYHKRYMRLSYTVTGGAGTVTALVTNSLLDFKPIEGRELY